MISAIQSALSGLNAASLKLNQAAANVAGGATSSVLPAGTSAFQDTASVGLAGGAARDPFTLLSGDGSLASDFVAFKEAELLYTASARLIGALGKLQGELLNTIS